MSPLPAAGGALAWSLGAYVLLRLVVASIASLGGRPLDILTLGAASAAVYSLGAWAVVRTSRVERNSPRPLAMRPTHPALVLVGVALGMSLKLPAESLRSLTERHFPTAEEVLLRKAMLYRTHDLSQVLALVTVVCLVGPLVEELFFRGALFGRLHRSSVALAAGLSGVLFVVAHDDPRDWPALLLVAAALSLMRAVGGSLLPCLGLHVAFNAVGVLALVTGAATVSQPLDVSPIVVASSWLAVAGLSFAVLRLGTTPEVERARAEDES